MLPDYISLKGDDADAFDVNCMGSKYFYYLHSALATCIFVGEIKHTKSIIANIPPPS